MKKHDLIIVGGGFSGTCAALAAKREGLSVLILEKSNALGGAANNALVSPFMPNGTSIDSKYYELSGGLFREIRDELYEMRVDSGILPDDPYRRSKAYIDVESLKLLLNRKINAAGVDVLFHATLCGVKRDGEKLASVSVATKCGVMEFEANRFIDATGDGLLSVLSGCGFQLGRAEDNLCQPMTLCFRVGNIDTEKYVQERPLINKLYAQAQAEGKIKNPRADVLAFSGLNRGVVHFNTTRVVKMNPTDPFDVTKAEMEAREQVHELVKFLRENTESCKNAELLITASEIGVRESRMIKGEYTLTGTELRNLCRFDDSIALGNYDIDIHSPVDGSTSHYYFKPGEYYEIPYRVTVPQGIDNLLVTGRCASCDHEAQASIRIMPIAANLGEAAGTAAAVAEKDGTAQRNVDVKKVQNILTAHGGIVHIP